MPPMTEGGPRFALQTGARMPAVGFGTWGVQPSAMPAAIRAAVTAGYRLFDLAAVYNNERAVGQVLAELQIEGAIQRSDIFLTSKVPPTSCSREGVLQTCEQSLKHLGTSYIDLYLVHWPFCVKANPPTWPPPKEYQLGYSPSQLRETWRAMEELQRSGKVRAIGLSNIGLRRLQNLLAEPDLEVKPAVVQIEFHPYLQSPSLVNFCLSRGIRVTAYSSLGSAMRPAKYKDGDDPVLLQDPVLLKVAAQAGESPAAVALAWAVSKGVAVIPKSATPERIQENFVAARLALSPAVIAAIDGMELGHRFLQQGWFGYSWKDGQTLAQLLDDEEPSGLSGWLGAHKTALVVLAIVVAACATWPRRRAR